MFIELSEQDVDLIIISLKGFIDDNMLYADQISSRMTSKQTKSIDVLNKQAEMLILNLETQEATNNQKTKENEDNKNQKKYEYNTKESCVKSKKKLIKKEKK